MDPAEKKRIQLEWVKTEQEETSVEESEWGRKKRLKGWKEDKRESDGALQDSKAGASRRIMGNSSFPGMSPLSPSIL